MAMACKLVPDVDVTDQSRNGMEWRNERLGQSLRAFFPFSDLVPVPVATSYSSLVE